MCRTGNNYQAGKGYREPEESRRVALLNDGHQGDAPRPNSWLGGAAAESFCSIKDKGADMRWQQALAVVVVSLAAVPAFGQAGGGAGGGGAGGPGGGRNFDPAQFRQRMEDRIKEQLGASEDDWKALQPRVDKVLELQRDANFRGGFRGGRRGGGQGGPNATQNPPTTPIGQKAEALRTLLDNKDAKADDIKAALTALRQAREQAKSELVKAQDDLRGLLTVKQESELVMAGLLE